MLSFKTCQISIFSAMQILLWKKVQNNEINYKLISEASVTSQCATNTARIVLVCSANLIIDTFNVDSTQKGNTVRNGDDQWSRIPLIRQLMAICHLILPINHYYLTVESHYVNIKRRESKNTLVKLLSTEYSLRH